MLTLIEASRFPNMAWKRFAVVKAEVAARVEEVVLFRKDMILGRILRFQGEFTESLTHLERARKATEQRKGLIFDEDLRDLTCDLADTLRELDQPVSAEHYLRAEISRRKHNCISSPGGSLLELSLAEVYVEGQVFVCLAPHLAASCKEPGV